MPETTSTRVRRTEGFLPYSDQHRYSGSHRDPEASYEEFLQFEVEPERRKDHGLQAALASVFPIPDYNNGDSRVHELHARNAEVRRA